MNTRKNVQKALFSKVESDSEKQLFKSQGEVDNAVRAADEWDRELKSIEAESLASLDKVTQVIKSLPSADEFLSTAGLLSVAAKRVSTAVDEFKTKIAQSEKDLGVRIELPKSVTKAEQMASYYKSQADKFTRSAKAYDKKVSSLL